MYFIIKAPQGQYFCPHCGTGLFQIFLIFSKKCVDKLRLVCYYSYAVYKTYGGIAQLARAFGSYPECPRFKSRCRYQTKAQRTIYTAPFIWPVGQEVKTPPFHGGNMGSSPVRVTKRQKPRDGCYLGVFFIFQRFAGFQAFSFLQ